MVTPVVSMVGAHGTGKSTLSKIIFDMIDTLDNQSVFYIEECAREVLDEFDVKENFTALPVEKIIEIQKEILRRKWDRRVAAEGRYEVIIEDRHPLIDVYAYSNYWLSRHSSAHDFLSEVKQGIGKHYFNETVIFVPPNIPLIGDGVRADQEHFRDTISYIIRGMLDEHNIKYYPLKSDSIGGRVGEVINIMNSGGILDWGRY